LYFEHNRMPFTKNTSTKTSVLIRRRVVFLLLFLSEIWKRCETASLSVSIVIKKKCQSVCTAWRNCSIVHWFRDVGSSCFLNFCSSSPFSSLRFNNLILFSFVFISTSFHLCFSPSAFWLLTFQSLAVSLRNTRFNSLKTLHGARFALTVLCGSENKQWLLLYTSLTDWFV